MKNASQHRIQSRCRLSYIWERWSDLRSGSRATHAEQTCKLLDLELSTGPLLAQRENELVRKNRSHCVVTTHTAPNPPLLSLYGYAGVADDALNRFASRHVLLRRPKMEKPGIRVPSLISSILSLSY